MKIVYFKILCESPNQIKYMCAGYQHSLNWVVWLLLFSLGVNIENTR